MCVWLLTSFDSCHATFLKIRSSGTIYPILKMTLQNKLRWLITVLKESTFPSTVFDTPQWNLVDAAIKLQHNFIEHQVEEHCNTHALRITLADFSAAFTDKLNVIITQLPLGSWSTQELDEL